MAATNRERQAAFKRNMRDAGMRQVTIWLDPNQEQEVKALLSGSRQEEAETTRLANWAEKLAQEQHQLDTRRNELDALVAETNLLKDNLKKRELDVSLKPKTASTAAQEEIPSHADRVARLVEWFTTRKDWRSGELQSLTDSYSALNKAAEMVNLSRQTKAAGTAIKSLLSTYGEEKHALLNTSEASVLKSALSVLNRLGEAAGDAKDRVNRTAKRVKAEEAARYKAAHTAIKTAFPDLQMTDAILLLCHMGDVVNYELLKVARTKPSGTDWAFDFMSDVRDMQRAAIDGAETRVRNAMLKDGGTAVAEATALRTSFDASRAELLARQESLVKHAVTCMTAAMLERSK